MYELTVHNRRYINRTLNTNDHGKVSDSCNELHFINKERIHREVEKMVESLDMAAGSTKGFDLYTVVESYFTDLEKRREINRLLHIEKDECEAIEEELGVYEM